MIDRTGTEFLNLIRDLFYSSSVTPRRINGGGLMKSLVINGYIRIVLIYASNKIKYGEKNKSVYRSVPLIRFFRAQYTNNPDTMGSRCIKMILFDMAWGVH